MQYAVNVQLKGLVYANCMHAYFEAHMLHNSSVTLHHFEF